MSRIVRNDEVTFDILEHIGVISTNQAWNKELNIVSWNGGPAKLDIRDWDPEHEKLTRGITLFEEDFKQLITAYGKWRATNGSVEETKDNFPIIVEDESISCYIHELIGKTAHRTGEGWHKELNIVSWNGEVPKVDIRDWNPEHTRMTRGVSLSQVQADQLLLIYRDYIKEKESADE